MTSTELVASGGNRPVSFAPKTLGEAMEFAKLIANSSFVPQEYRGRAGDILVAIQMGAELGLSPMQSLQSISVINGRPSVWGDAAIALVRASGLLEDFEEKVEGSGENRVGYCRAKRKGQATSIEKRFSVADAKRARLWGKKGPWETYPDRMLVMRARGFVLRDGFADALRGLITREEAADMPTVDEQVKEHLPESDLPWVKRKSQKGTADQDLTAALEASVEAANGGGVASDSFDDTVEVPSAEEDETSPPGASELSEVEAAPPSPHDDIPPPWAESSEAPSEESPMIGVKEQKRLHACRSEGKHSEDETKKWLYRFFGVTSTTQVTRDQLHAICNRLRDPTPLPS